MNQSTLVKSLPIVAKALGRNMGVKVELDASHAWTDGNVIYLNYKNSTSHLLTLDESEKLEFKDQTIELN